jgi:hypothetical protein
MAMSEQKESPNQTKKLAELLEIPKDCICPFSQHLMEDPVIAADGMSYERKFIEEWFKRRKWTSPMTNKRLPHRTLIPNHQLRQTIKTLRKQFPDIQRKLIEERTAQLDLKAIIKLCEKEMEERLRDKDPDRLYRALQIEKEKSKAIEKQLQAEKCKREKLERDLQQLQAQMATASLSDDEKKIPAVPRNEGLFLPEEKHKDKELETRYVELPFPFRQFLSETTQQKRHALGHLSTEAYWDLIKPEFKKGLLQEFRQKETAKNPVSNDNTPSV